MENTQVPPWQRYIAIPGMLFFGTCTVVIQKFLFQQKALGSPEYGEHKFMKPWFQTNSMFIGMFLSLIVYEIQRCLHKKKDFTIPLQEESKPASNFKLYFCVAVPACCDLLATSLMNIGLLYIEASVWQMLRGSMVLFSSIFCAFILKRPHYPYMWWSVLVITIALSIVGFSIVASTGVGRSGVSEGKVILAILLTIGSQIISATQIVVEDYLLHDLVASPFLIVGVEGLWGTIITCVVFLPLNQFAFKNLPEGEGLHEDTIDTFKMIGNSAILIVFIIAYVLVILFYNVTAMFVTNITSAVVRTILEGLRTLCIWLVQLIIFYASEGTKYGNENPDIGEEWTQWSFMQLAGFFMLFTGMLLYNKILKLPFLNYPEDSQEGKHKNPDDVPLITE